MYGFIITTAGEGLLARASAGEGLTITEVWVGKGCLLYTSPSPRDRG